MLRKCHDESSLVRKLFVLLAAVWLVLNLITLTGYPAVWVDETLFSDPSVHLALGKGFVSSVWYNQPSWDFWAGYTPLYSFALAGWLKAFGISEITVRSFGLLLSTASLFMLWLLLKRVGDDSLRLTIILAVAVCEPVAFLERAGRQDSICLFLLAATALVFAEKTWRWRSALLWMLGALSLPAALQYTAYILVLGALVHFWFKPFSKRDLLLWVTGAASGSLVLAAIYSAHHVLKMFIEVTFLSQHSSIGRLLQRIVLGHGPEPFSFSYISTAWVRDFATPVLILGSSVAWFLARRQNDRSASQWSSFALACSVLIPLAIQLLGQYPIYYTYMGAVPATVAVLVAAKQLKGPSTLYLLRPFLCSCWPEAQAAFGGRAFLRARNPSMIRIIGFLSRTSSSPTIRFFTRCEPARSRYLPRTMLAANCCATILQIKQPVSQSYWCATLDSRK